MAEPLGGFRPGLIRSPENPNYSRNSCANVYYKTTDSCHSAFCQAPIFVATDGRGCKDSERWVPLDHQPAKNDLFRIAQRQAVRAARSGLRCCRDVALEAQPQGRIALTQCALQPAQPARAVRGVLQVPTGVGIERRWQMACGVYAAHGWEQDGLIAKPIGRRAKRCRRCGSCAARMSAGVMHS